MSENNEENLFDSVKVSQNIEENDYIFKEVFQIAKDIYTSRDIRGIYPPKYYVSNDQIEIAAKRVMEKYDLKTIRQFYDDVKKRELCGRSDYFTLTKFEEDIEKFLDPEKIEQITPFDKSNLYMHTIYAPNNTPDQSIIKQCNNEHITKLTQMAMKKFGPKAIEILMDYKLELLDMGRSTIDFSEVCSDIMAAIKWQQIKNGGV